MAESPPRRLPRAGTAPAALQFRLFWTWDHSTTWRMDMPGRQEHGAANAYAKPAEAFLEDYRRVIDFANRHRINGIVVYGFLRDRHGGVETAKELCRYANARGVRIIPGVGINAYGGVYYDGRHRFNLRTWLLDHPELRAQPEPDPHTRLAHHYYADMACPSQPANREWHAEAIQWLSEEFEIGGINFETGDYGICRCPLCESRRGGETGRWSISDVAELYPTLFAAARRARPEAWMIAEAYFDNLLELDAIAPLAALPPETICQYTINRRYWPRVKAELTPAHVRRLPTRSNVVRTHMGSQWGSEDRERYRLVARDFADLARLAAATGMQGMNVFGEVSSLETANEINYLAFATFANEPATTWEAFLDRVLGPRLGGAAAAAEYLSLLELLQSPADEAGWRAATGRARELAAGCAGDEQHRRWVWLLNRLYQVRGLLAGSGREGG